MTSFFVTGIDTDIGKTVVTGTIAKFLLSKGLSVTTMKPVQTGCTGIAEDILEHRSIMGIEPDDFDKEGVTAPVVFKYPASPHLAAELEGKVVDFDLIKRSLSHLEKNFDHILIEGAGGLIVPLTKDFTTLDFIIKNELPVILVSSSRLGSINHTMLTIEVLKSHDVPIAAVIYNEYPKELPEITTDSFKTIKHLIEKQGVAIPVIRHPAIDKNSNETPDFNELLPYFENPAKMMFSVKAIGKMLIEKNITISGAESCTGGLITSKLTEIPGISKVLKETFVTYANESKMRIPGVKKETIEKYGAVSEECVKEMAQGVAKISGSDIAFAVSGIAGPDGGTKEKPVGTVCFALFNGNKTITETRLFSGTRNLIREKAALHMLCMIERFI
jgi:dethiobiotin synthetase